MTPKETADRWMECFERCTPKQQERWRSSLRPLFDALVELALTSEARALLAASADKK